MRLILCLPIFLVLVSCGNPPSESDKAPTPVHLSAVEMYTPGAGQMYTASILPERQVNLAFRVNGLVTSIAEIRGADHRLRAIDLGDIVQEGSILAQVRSQDFQLQVSQIQGQVQQAKQSAQAASAQLQQAQASATKAQEDFDRADALYKQASLTKSDYDAAKANRDATRAQVEAAQAQQQASAGTLGASEATLGTANLNLSDSTLKAPFTGVIVQRSVDIGSLAGPGLVAFVLADISSVKATFAVSDIAVAHLRKGSSMTIYAEAFPNRTFRGFINTIAGVADSNTRSFQVEVSIPNDHGMLRPGMIASLDLTHAAQGQPVLVAPLDAVVPSGNGSGQFAVMTVASGVARRLPVTLGATYGDRIAVSGVSAGEKVISSGATFVSDGDAVTVLP